MRAVGLASWVFAVGCSFGSPVADPPITDPPGDGPADGPRADAPPIDGPPSKARRKRITIDPMRVTGNHPAFPVWIVIDNDNDLKMRATGTGADLHFTRPDGTPLPYQIQRWVQADGDLEAWVRADLDDNAPTVIELRYGEPATAHAANPPAVFSSSFAAVWHLEDPLDTTAVAEATNQRAGTAQGGLGATAQVAAQLGGGVNFDGINTRIRFANPFAGGGDHTFSAWVNQRTGNGFDSIVTVGSPQQNQSRFFYSHYQDGVSAGFYQNDLPGSLTDIDNAGWVLVHWTWNNTTRRSRVYRDGAPVDDRMLGPSAINTQGADGHLGYAPNQWGPGGNTPCTLNGILDEVRLATVERNAGWIATEYANQRVPGLFYAVGAEQMVP